MGVSGVGGGSGPPADGLGWADQDTIHFRDFLKDKSAYLQNETFKRFWLDTFLFKYMRAIIDKIADALTEYAKTNPRISHTKYDEIVDEKVKIYVDSGGLDEGEAGWFRDTLKNVFDWQ